MGFNQGANDRERAFDCGRPQITVHTQRTQTSTKVKISTRDSNPDFRITLSVSVISPSRENRDANKSPKIPYSAVVGKWKSGPESVSGTGLPPKLEQFFRLIGPNINEIAWLLLQQSCTRSVSQTEWQTERSSDKQTAYTLIAQPPPLQWQWIHRPTAIKLHDCSRSRNIRSHA